MGALGKVLIAFAILMLGYFPTMFLLKRFEPTCPRGTALELKPPFPAYGTGAAYSAEAPSLEQFSDSNTASTRSSYVVCENRYVLGPAHVEHAEIAAKGKGRFSHYWRS
jgi:hypothetical protein